MVYEKYRHRRQGAGHRRFFLVDYWFKDGLKVRDLTKGTSGEKLLRTSTYKVRRNSPPTHNGEDEAPWEWDDKIHREPISRSRARPSNETELQRASESFDERKQELREVSGDTPAAKRLESDLRFLRAVMAEYRLWLIRQGFEVPTEDSPDRKTTSGYRYARKLYDYLDLEDKAPSDIRYTALSQLLEDAQTERPGAFMLAYNGFNKALKKADFYPTGDDAAGRSNSEKLVELFRRIKDYVENGRWPG